MTTGLLTAVLGLLFVGAFWSLREDGIVGPDAPADIPTVPTGS